METDLSAFVTLLKATPLQPVLAYYLAAQHRRSMRWLGYCLVDILRNKQAHTRQNEKAQWCSEVVYDSK